MKTTKLKLALVALGGLLVLPVAQASENLNNGYYYYPGNYNNSGYNNFFDNSQLSSDSYGSGRGNARGEAEFSMSISGKGKGEQTRDLSFGNSSYGGNSNYNAYPPRASYPAPYSMQR